MRFAGKKLMEEGIIGANDVPTTKGVEYPQDHLPAGMFGDGVNPTDLPMMRYKHMQSPEGGLAQLAPSMVDGYVDHPAVQDTNMPYILTPDIQQLRRESMNQFQELPTDMLKRFGFKGV